MRLTSNQQRVLAMLQQSTRPLSAYAILESLRGDGFSAPTQIYRALGHLADIGLVHRLESMNAYVTCSQPCTCEESFRAFAICDNCGHVDEFAAPALKRYLGGWIKQNAFSLDSSTIELHGKCAACNQLEVNSTN
ncbi:transcriptional repressor [Pseudomonas syringae pv. syringae]|nr:transcriptional repressor [Pseudomonas syringae pv. syringae]